MRLAVEPLTLRLRRPLRTAFGELDRRTLLRVRLESGDGLEGTGEAAPLEAYDGVALGAVADALDAYRPLVERWDGRDGAELLERCRAVAAVPHALAAIDVALWDRAGHREGRPVAQLLAEQPLATIPVNAMIGATDRTGAAAEAGAAAAAGYRCIKVKVGAGDDAGRIAAVRAAIGPEPQLRVDANGAWTVPEAEAALAALAPAGLELAEEPVHGLGALRELRERTAVRIAMDETCAEHGALASGAADAVCLKLARCGGISGLLAAAALVRATGAEPYVSSTLDGPAGIAAAVHAAAAIAPQAACGLATLELFDVDPGPLAVADGTIPVPAAPGLGTA